MSLEYAPRGFIGLLTPQANTTVEPECNILFPDWRCVRAVDGVECSAASLIEMRLQARCFGA